jgi:transcriptional regulator with XRE-family HTH domain
VDDFRARFGRHVRELRVAARLTQKELGARAGLHQTYIGGIERGGRNPGLLNVELVAGGLDISLADLFSAFQAVPTTQDPD